MRKGSRKIKSRGLKRALAILRGIEKERVACIKNASQIEFESLLSRALNQIENIKRIGRDRYAEEGDSAIIQAWNVYSNLQRSKNDPAFFMDNTRNRPGRVIHQGRPASVRWDAAAMMATTRFRGYQDTWWRPPPRRSQVKHYTQEEIEREFPGKIYKRR